jgi:hypothetical protein
MKLSNRLGVSLFCSVSFSHTFFGLRRPAAFVLAPPISKRLILCDFPEVLPEETRVLHIMFCGTSAQNFSISITFDIGYEHLLIKYMLE